MKKLLFAISVVISFLSATGQIEVDKSIELTGAGNDARISGIDSVASSQDAVNVKTLQQGRLLFAPATSSGDNYQVQLSPSVTSYEPGMSVSFKASHANAGASMISVNGLAFVPLKKYATDDLDANDIKNGQLVTAMYDGTNFQIMSQLASAPSAPCNVPAQPGPISGLTYLNANSDGIIYSIEPYLGVFTYEWTVSGGPTLVSGQGSISIEVDFGTASGTISVVGVNHCGPSAPRTINVTVPQSLNVFVSSTELSPNTSVAARDAQCQSDAQAAGLPGNYKAWLGSGGGNNVPATSGLPYRLVDNTSVASSWSDLVDGTINNPINRTASGVTFSGTVWTGLNSDGTASSSTCTNWTFTPSPSAPEQGVSGSTTATNGSWTSQGAQACYTRTQLVNSAKGQYANNIDYCTCIGEGWARDPNTHTYSYQSGWRFGVSGQTILWNQCGYISAQDNWYNCVKDEYQYNDYRHYCFQQP